MAEVEIKQENLVYSKSNLILDNVMHYLSLIHISEPTRPY